MGKSRRNRARPRKDPLAKTTKPPSDPELAALREKSVLPVIRDLQSSDPKSRSSAAAAVSNVVSDARCRKLLLKEQIVHIVLTQTLSDASIESRAAGWEILRVLAEEEEADFCVHLFRQDVLSAVEFTARASVEAIATKEKMGKAEIKFNWALIESMIALVAAMCEARDLILEAVVSISNATVTLLEVVLKAQGPPPEVRLGALSCLLVLVEDNKTLAEHLASNDPLKLFPTLLELQKVPGRAADRVLTCGILHEVFSSLNWHDGSPGDKALSDARLVRTLAAVLEEGENLKTEEGLSEHNQWAKPEEVRGLAVEILASIGTSLQDSMASRHGKQREAKEPEGERGGINEDGDGDGDEAMDEDEDTEKANGGKEQGDDEDMDDSKHDDVGGEDEGMDEDDIADIQADMEMVTGGDDTMDAGGSASDDLSTLTTLVDTAVPQLIRLANPPARTEKGDAIRLQSLSLSALNNAAWSVSCFDFSRDENAGILKTWTPAAESIWKDVVSPVLAANTADVELASAITSLAWATLRTLPRDRLPLQGDEHRKFVSLYHAAKSLDEKKRARGNGGEEKGEGEEDPFQALGVKCVGVLGQLALETSASANASAGFLALNRDIGDFLVSVVSSLPDCPPADVVEALNQLFDVYGDEDRACDRGVFWKEGFLGRLEQAVPKVKAMLKTIDKRSHKELRARADEASLNLGRFVQYKKKNKPT